MPSTRPYPSTADNVHWTSSPTSHLRLGPQTKENNDADIEPMDLSRMDDDPISYFLTPAPGSLLDPYSNGEDPMDFEMEFDAGIEDFKHPAPIIRSVSPSSLEGLSLPPHRPPTPPGSPGTPDSSTDMPLTPDDGEDYMRFALKGRSLTLPIRLSDLTGGGRKSRREHHRLSPSSSSEVVHGSAVGSPVRVPSPLSGYTTSSSSNSSTSTSSTMPMPPRRRSPHAWRQPSPDVYSIMEETQDAIESEIGTEDNISGYNKNNNHDDRAKARAIEIPAAKPGKRVRFVLPVLD
ncbi:hypothetical protein QBC37DRAFT_280563 [Rhypophila decipiens]|uniref:Uncharacterized protein n=1 Tax=Rhypophila decipiens TaxID=261697 RepID=A0AAN6YCE2_9PEZI|nr:hypothetical protein QBC37DRAFT_280563 [Rhypophila decipiens]